MDSLNPKRVVGLGFISLLLFLSGIFAWLTPLPTMFAFKKGGRKAALLSLLVGFLTLLVLYQVLVPFLQQSIGNQEAAKYLFWMPGIAPQIQASMSPLLWGISYYAFYGAAGWILARWEAQDLQITILVGRTVGFLSLGSLVWVLILTQGDLFGFIQSLEESLISLLKQVEAVAKQNSEMRLQWTFIQEHQKEIAYYVVRLMPAMLVDTAIFLAWFNVVVARRLFVKEAFFAKLAPLKEWSFPFWGVWAAIAMGFLLFLEIYSLQSSFLRLLAINVLLVLALIYFFQGLAIGAFYLGKWPIPSLFKLILYVFFILFFQPLGILFLALGFFDSWFNFRRIQCSSS